MRFSVIIPVYNRPKEIDELLQSLCEQTFTDFEVLVIEDGSEEQCETIVSSYDNDLKIRYYYKENSGQGFSRNFGFERAHGQYLVVFDSDCTLPPHYFQVVNSFISRGGVDAWGGPDRAHPSFTTIQKAISYAMTSPLSTGGIRGSKHSLERFYPRSFNMGISRKVFEDTGGYLITRMGEDLEFSIRIVKAGFRTVLLEEAWVWHKRRINFRSFFRQLHFFGRARIHLLQFHPEQLNALHLLPSIFLIALCISGLAYTIDLKFAMLLSTPFFLYWMAIWADALWKERNIGVACLSVVAVTIQLSAYGAGVIRESVVRMFRKRAFSASG
ncbi:MAG: glycosyltransferase [Balneolaceae bacterium]